MSHGNTGYSDRICNTILYACSEPMNNPFISTVITITLTIIVLRLLSIMVVDPWLRWVGI